MLNRRILRVKVMQALYGHFQAEDADVVKNEKNLMLSINRVYDLYLHFMVLPIELADLAEVQMEEARNKALPSPEDLNPNRRFVDSYVVKALRDNKELAQLLEERKISWGREDDRDALKKVWRNLKASSLYANYLEEEESPAAHRKFVEKVVTQFILDNDDIYSLFQERSIYWDYEDCDFALNMALRYFGKVKSLTHYKPIPGMWKDKDEDERFVKNLFVRSINNNQENSMLIDAKTKNWEVERIAVLDVLFMKMAITEFLHFSSIPIKVTLNEYIEISKMFSTPKSKVFINGVLDKLLADFKRENKLKKTGRGLMQ
jgi:N utilization substance protein B